MADSKRRNPGPLLVTGHRLVTDAFSLPTQPAALLIDQATGRLLAVGQEAFARQGEASMRTHFQEGTLAPALIDCHVHLVLPGDGSFGEASLDLTDDELMARSLQNAETALRAGVVALQDQGSRGSVGLAARAATHAKLDAYPSVSVAGRPITVSNGHMWYYGGPADGADAVRTLANELVDDGVDLIKLVASGGGTKGSNEFEASYTVSELRAGVEVAHEHDLVAAAHAGCAHAIANACEAGCDVIHHCNFYTPRGVQEFDQRLANRLAEAGVAVDPTLWVTQSLLEALRPRAGVADRDRKDELDRFERHWAGKHRDVRGLIEAGVRLIAGSDAGWRYVGFGDTWREVVALADFGLSNKEAYAAATTHAATALRRGDRTGRLKRGYDADFLVLAANPTEDLSSLGKPAAVYRLGARVP